MAPRPSESPQDPAAIKAAIRARALELGFDAAGFAPAELAPEHGARLTEFLAQGRHGAMAWMAEKAARRVSPRALWPEVRSVVVLAVNYGPAEDPLRHQNRPERGLIAAYARNNDYHDLVKKRLKALARWMVDGWSCEVKVFVDTAPVMEKPLAQLAGLGWQGKHTNLVSRQFGSWLLLGEVFTTLELPPDRPEADHCGSCRRCLDACPTGALDAPYRMDARKCISYLTIEHPGEIAPELAARMGNHVFGCDDCLTACPWNKFTRVTDESQLMPRLELTALRLGDLALLDEAGFRQVFRGSPVKRSGWARMMRNVRIAKNNHKASIDTMRHKR